LLLLLITKVSASGYIIWTDKDKKKCLNSFFIVILFGGDTDRIGNLLSGRKRWVVRGQYLKGDLLGILNTPTFQVPSLRTSST